MSDLGFGLYDYGARFYDVNLARFTTIDPRVDEYYSWSPYNYTGNNPVRRVDINGEGWGDVLRAAKNYVVNAVKKVITRAAKATVQSAKNEASRLNKEYGPSSVQVGGSINGTAGPYKLQGSIKLGFNRSQEITSNVKIALTEDASAEGIKKAANWSAGPGAELTGDIGFGEKNAKANGDATNLIIDGVFVDMANGNDFDDAVKNNTKNKVKATANIAGNGANASYTKEDAKASFSLERAVKLKKPINVTATKEVTLFKVEVDTNSPTQ